MNGAIGNAETPLNMDRLAAKHAQRIVRRAVEGGSKPTDLDNTVTKTLGVFLEDGVYACFLYLLAKEKEKGRGWLIVEEMLGLLEKLGFGWTKPERLNEETVLEFVSETVTKELEKLLFAKEILERMLVYARYGAKAQPEPKGTPETPT